MPVKRLHARITGRVQGVAFRAFTKDTAQHLGLSGWVRNEPEGSVELLAEGDETALAQLLGAVRRGPSGARVDAVDETWSDATDTPAGRFDIRF